MYPAAAKVRHISVTVVCTWLCLVHLPVATSWSCSLSMTGSLGQPENLSLVQTILRCSPSEGDVGTALPVWVSDSLSTINFEGVQIEPLPAVYQTYMLLYFERANITFEGAQVHNINTGSLADILQVASCPVVVFNNFSSSGCQAKHQILDIINSTVYISNSSFRNAPTRGLSIVNSTTDIRDTVFENLACPQDWQKGGALYVDNSGGNVLHVQASNFSNNHANGTRGGAMYLKCTTCHFKDVRFVENSSGQHGGAVLIDKPDKPGPNDIVTFDNCVFANNTAGYSGVVYGYYNVGSISFANCTFIGNVGYQGGALSFWGVYNVLIDSSRFEANSVNPEPGKSYHPGTGAALYVTGYDPRITTLFIMNSTFSQNYGVDSPGSAAVVATQCKCIGIIDSMFENNLGVALGIDKSDSLRGDCGHGSLRHLPLFNLSTIVGNTDQYLDQHIGQTQLGASTTVDVRSTIFSKNVDSTLLPSVTTKVVPYYNYRGGAALNIRSTQNIVLSDLHFVGNKAWQAGALFLDTCSSTVVWSSNFTGNSATREGGAIATINNLHTEALFMGNITAMDNSAMMGGVIYGTDDASIIIANGSTFDGNMASSHGGAVACVDCASLTLLGVSMTANQADLIGGALYAQASAALELEDVQYIGNWAAVGGAAYIAGVVSQTNITNNIFHSNSANKSSLGLERGGGGALYLDGGVTQINGSIFKQNSASGYGGGLVYKHKSLASGEQPENAHIWAGFEPPVGEDFSVVRSVGATNLFVNNHADMAGGAVYASHTASLSLTCPDGLPWDDVKGCPTPAWAGNTAGGIYNKGLGKMLGYGSELAYAPHSINLAGPPVVVYTSDGSTSVDFKLWATDIVGQNVTAGVSIDPLVGVKPLEASVNLAPLPADIGHGNPSMARLAGRTTGTADPTGLIDVSDLVVSAIPGDYKLSVTLTDFPTVPAAWKTLQVQHCSSGQITEDSNRTCRVCGNSTFSMNPLKQSCDPCPSGADCHGADVFIPPKHSWHSSPNSTTIVSCPNADACEGNRTTLLRCKKQSWSCNMTTSMVADDPNAYMFKMCSDGYYGPLCSLCLLHNAPPRQRPYGRAGTLECKPCRQRATIITAYIASTLLVMLWLTYIIHVTLTENEEDAQSIRQAPRVSEFLKALQLWLQYLALLAGVNMRTPYALHWVFSAANYAFSAVTSASFSMECLLSDYHNTALASILVHLAVPLLVLAAMLATQVVWWARKCKQGSVRLTPPRQRQVRALTSTSWKKLLLWQTRADELQCRMLVTLLSVLFYYYPSLLTTILSLFACYRIDPEFPATDGSELYPQYAQARHKYGYWVSDMTVECFSGWHKSISFGMGIPLAVLGCVIIPLLPSLLLLRHSRKLQTAHVKRRWGFLYCHYRRKFWYWETVVLVQTLGLAAAQVFANALDAFFQLTIMLVILITGSLALAYFHPFHQEASQAVQVLGLGTVMATALGCLMFLDKDHVASSVGLKATAVLLVIFNVAFLALVAWLVLKHGKRHITAFLRQAETITKGAFRLVTAAFLWCTGPFAGRAKQPKASLASPQADVSTPVRATRSGSVQPMLSERMLSQPAILSSSTSFN